ncbi:MAG: hypothetical protein ACLFN0_01710 [Thermovirgaceae bacterium]
MALSKRKLWRLKISLLIVIVFVVCLAAFSLFMTRVNAKIDAIELVKSQYLPKERRDSFVSAVNREGKFKLLGWDIKPADEEDTFIVSYRLKRLDEKGFAEGPEEGFWYRVNLRGNSCEQVFPPGTVTPEE